MSARPILVIGSTGKTGRRKTQRPKLLGREPGGTGALVRGLTAAGAWAK